MTEFSRRLAFQITAQEITRHDLADAISVSTGTINRYLSGKTVPKRTQMVLLSIVLGVSVEYLKGETA